MNCASCRQRLHPYLDDELDVADHVSILEHLDRCPPCRAAYVAEESMRRRLKEALTTHRCPLSVAAAFAKTMATERRRESVRRFAPPAALLVAASVVAFVVVRGDVPPACEGPAKGSLADATPRRLRVASRIAAPSACATSSHGPVVAWVEAQYDGLLGADLRPEEVLDVPHLEALRARGRDVLTPEAFRCAARARVGRELRLPEAFLGAEGRLLGGEILSFGGRDVLEAVVAFPDREVVVYEIPRAVACVKDLDDAPISCDLRGRFKACPECDVVAVVGDETVVLLVSRQFRDWACGWMFDKARTF